MYQPRNMLVTGSAGFIGSHFVTMMLNRYSDLHIVSLDKLTYAGDIKNLASVKENKHHQFFHGDIINADLVSKILHECDIDTIVHFAAETHVDNSISKPKQFIETNVLGTFTLLDQARYFWQYEKKWDKTQCRFHHISTDEVYGSLDAFDLAFNESTPYAPNSPYAASKAAADHLVRAYFQTYQLPITISHCSNNFGPRQHKEKLIPVVIQSCLTQKAIPVYGNGSNIRDWLYVDDHCDAIDLILKNGVIGESYNIGGNNELDNLSLIHLCCKIMDNYFPHHAPHKKLIHFATDRLGHDARYANNIHKIQSDLGWKPNRDFKVALHETINAFILEQL